MKIQLRRVDIIVFFLNLLFIPTFYNNYSQTFMKMRSAKIIFSIQFHKVQKKN